MQIEPLKYPDDLNIPTSTSKRVVIIGGGFAGLHLAKKLCSKQLQVVLIDKHNYLTFQPLLYQVATGYFNRCWKYTF